MTRILVHIGGTSGGNLEKADRKAGSVQSLENRQFYKTEGKKHQFIHESFQLDTVGGKSLYRQFKKYPLLNFKYLPSTTTNSNAVFRESISWQDREIESQNS